MATRTRTRSTARRRPPARTLTVSLGPRTARGRSRSSHGLGWLTFLLLRWVARRMGRAAAWTGRQAIKRSAGHVQRVRHGWRAWSDEKAQFGRHPVVIDLHAGTAHPARAVDVPLPTGGDLQVRARQDEDALRRRERLDQVRADNIFRHSRPPWWQRWLNKIGLWRINWDAVELSLQARYAVLAQRRERIARDAALFGPRPAPAPRRAPVTPVPVLAAPQLGSPVRANTVRAVRTDGDGFMSHDFVIRSWESLREPGIDPFEYPEELPEKIGEAATLVRDEAETVETIAGFYGKNVDAFKEYVEYMNTAGVDPSVIDLLHSASEAIEAAYAGIRGAAEQLNAAADLVEAARRAAEGVYGDHNVPRFDRANAS